MTNIWASLVSQGCMWQIRFKFRTLELGGSHVKQKVTYYHLFPRAFPFASTKDVGRSAKASLSPHSPVHISMPVISYDTELN